MSNGTGFRQGELDRANQKTGILPHNTPHAVRENHAKGFGKK
jgi:hypothetical protein